MHLALVLLLSLITSPVATHGLSLLDALRQHANASRFAQMIESDPEVSAIYRSGSVRTVFAPVNSALTRLGARDTDNQADLLRQSVNRENSLQTLHTPPGSLLETNDETGNLNGQGQAVVAHPSDGPTNNTKRALLPRQIANAPIHPIKISSGLGNNVSIIQGDIPYDGGLIHIVDDFFTKPITLSATSNQTGHSQFASRLDQSNLTHLIDTTPSITCFLPSNAAFVKATGNSTQTPSQIASQLSGHIVTDQVLYLPRLVDGATYSTKAGTTIVVSIRDGRYFINGAQIVQADVILENGVAHILDKIIVPTPTPASFSSSSSSIVVKPTIFVIIINILLYYLF